MLKDLFEFLAQKGLLSPTILAVAIVGVVYFQSGVDADQRRSIDDLHTQDKVITAQLQATSENLRVITVLLGRMDERGTKHEMEAREKDLDRREGVIKGK